MGRSLVKNISGITLPAPFPYAGAIKAGASAVLNGDPPVVIQALGGDVAVRGVFDVRPAQLGAGPSLPLVGMSTTLEALAIPINPTSTADPDLGTVFLRQEDIDGALDAKGVTAFKSIQACWNALPRALAFDVTFNLAAGVHRPRAGDLAQGAVVELRDRFSVGGVFKMLGRPPSEWTVEVPAASVSAIATGTNPSITCSGTPFAGLNLRGLHALASTGQVFAIHDHTDSILYVTANPSPSPVGGTVEVKRPSTILRNSLDDINAFVTGATIAWGIAGFTKLVSAQGYLHHEFSDLQVDTFSGSSAGWLFINSGVHGAHQVRFTRVLNDYEFQRVNFGRSPDGRSWQSSEGSSGYSLSLCCVRTGTIGGTNEMIFAGGSPGRHSWLLSDCVFYAPACAEHGIASFVRPASFTLLRTLIEIKVVTDKHGIHLENGSQLTSVPASTGINNAIRTAYEGLFMSGGSRITSEGTQQSTTFHMQFGGITNACVRMIDYAQLALRSSGASDGIRNLAIGAAPPANTGHGLRVDGPFSFADLNAGSNANGTAGDVRLPDGSTITYATLVSTGPLKADLCYIDKQ